MSIEQRNRKHIEAHLRSLDQQILDALLRIEELITNHIQSQNQTSVAKLPSKSRK